jgi:outer membrane biosynthesis protein TonB
MQMTVPKVSLLVVCGAFASCGSIPHGVPASRPAEYVNYRPPVECADSAASKTVPMPRNHDDVRRMAVARYPDVMPANGGVKIVFLWYFVREDGRVAEVRPWRSSGSYDIDRIALELGREMYWHPATCAGKATAMWYGHPIAIGGADR